VARHKANREQLLKELAGLARDTNRQKFLSQNRSLLQPELVSELADKVREQVRVDVTQALHLADAALAIAHQLKSNESQAIALRAKANVLYATGEHAAAADLHEQAAGLFEAVGGNRSGSPDSEQFHPTPPSYGRIHSRLCCGRTRPQDLC